METKKDLENLELVKRATKFYDAVVESGNLHNKVEVTPERIQFLRVGLGIQNSLISAFKVRKDFFKLTDVNKKISTIKKYQK